MSRRRITIEVPEELKEKLEAQIPWGLFAPVMRIILYDLVSMLEDSKDLHRILINRIIQEKLPLQEWSSITPKTIDVCPDCGNDVQELKDRKEGQTYTVMYWCQVCDKEVT